MKPHYLVIGAGFSGAVLARELVESEDCKVSVFEAREHLAGNCHTERDEESGVMLHKFGPHIFNTDDEEVWKYVNRFGTWKHFSNRVKSVTPSGVYSLPINLHTINQFFGKRFCPEEAKKFVASLGDRSIREAKNFEEQALKMIGEDLYREFFYGYTLKQWGCEPAHLPASILKRLPIRFNYNDEYYDKRYQAIPLEGYTQVITRILSHPDIEVSCSRPFDAVGCGEYSHMFFTGPIDSYFKYSLGRLGYRSIVFERKDYHGDYQGTAVLNYPSLEVKYTRVHEHKHFAPWEKHDLSPVFTEFSHETGEGDLPYYPKRLSSDKLLLEDYCKLAAQEERVSFLGRLGTYRYLDMEAVIREARQLGKCFVNARQQKMKLPVMANTLS